MTFHSPAFMYSMLLRTAVLLFGAYGSLGIHKTSRDGVFGLDVFDAHCCGKVCTVLEEYLLVAETSP